MITEKSSQKPIIQQMREVMRRMHYAYKTENTYCDWVKRFIKFSSMQSREALLVKDTALYCANRKTSSSKFISLIL